MNEEDPALTAPRDQTAPIRLREKIPSAILFTLAFLLVLPIPFLIFLIVPDRLSKKARNIVGFVLWGLATACQLASIILSVILFTELYPVTTPVLDPLAAAPFSFLEGQFDLFAVMMGLVVLNAIFLNRFATNILANEEARFRVRGFTIIERITLAFKWKNERTALASGNETLMKVKNANTAVALFGIVVLLLTYFLPEFQVPLVLEYLTTGDDAVLSSLLVEDFVAAAVYVVVACGLFAVAFFLASFYSGRAITYQGQHYWRQRRFSLAIALKGIGYATSLSSLLPAILCLAGMPPYEAMLATVPVSLVGGGAWLVIQHIFWRQPREIALDPKARAIKERVGMIKDPEHRGRAGQRGDLPKSWGFWFLVLAITGLSAINGAIWFPATVLYAQASDWYEWGFYWWAGVFIVVGPIVLLFFLRSVYARRVLMGYLLATLLLMAIEFSTVLPLSLEPAALVYTVVFPGLVGFTGWEDPLSASGRQLHVIGLIGGVVVALVALFILKRKALPIPITTPKHPSGFSSWRNLIAFITGRGGKDTIRNTVALVFLATSLAGVCLTFQPQVNITLERPAGHQMRVSFWDSGFRSQDKLPNSTLTILGDNNIRLYGWFTTTDVAGASRYADFGVEVVPVTGAPKNETDLAAKIASLNVTMNFWDLNGLHNNPFIGFTFDHEEMRGLARFNATQLDTMNEMVTRLADFVTSRGYQLFSTTYLMPVNDLLDGDEDVSTINFIPFDPAWNVSHFDWMVYRTEIAIEYDEPSPAFTYEWARWIRHFMLQTGGPALLAKASMSIGVTSEELPLYRGPGGFDEFMMDVKICHAMDIPEIKIFYLGSATGNTFLGLWGETGIIRILDEIQNYTSVSFPFVRRATFFGNLKGAENPTGSVFGFMYQDFWLEESIGVLSTVLLFALLLVPVILAAAGVRTLFPASRDCRTLPWKAWLDRTLMVVRLASLAMIVLLAIWMPLALANFEIFTWDPSLFM